MKVLVTALGQGVQQDHNAEPIRRMGDAVTDLMNFINGTFGNQKFRVLRRIGPEEKVKDQVMGKLGSGRQGSRWRKEFHQLRTMMRKERQKKRY